MYYSFCEVPMQEHEIKKIYLGSLREIDPVKTFECGQCFRWNADVNGDYWGVARGKAARVITEGDEVYIISTQEDYEGIWRDYLDMERDYESIRLSFNAGEYLSRCAEFGAGIRILRQERWEALCSFIISQCNNIPRIKGIVEKLCRGWGDRFEFEGREFYSFPTPETVAALEAEDLAPIRSGYRAEYIVAAARAIVSGEVDLDALAAADEKVAMKALLSMKGVGVKVANCAMLFGLGHMEAFPIDVWMKRALSEHFAPDFKPESLGQYAGLAQQYIFYYARSGDGK